MVATNGITGDRLISKTNTSEYEVGWDRIFNKENNEAIRDVIVIRKEIDDKKRILREE